MNRLSGIPLDALITLLAALATSACQNARVETVGIQAGRIDVQDLAPAPINAAWIIEGAPKARARTLTVTADRNFSSTIWDCTAGTFRWHFRSDEFVHILDGEVVVRDPAGAERTLGVGDVALFPRGVTSVWRVPRYVRKLALHRSDQPSLQDRVARKLGMGR